MTRKPFPKKSVSHDLSYCRSTYIGRFFREIRTKSNRSRYLKTIFELSDVGVIFRFPVYTAYAGVFVNVTLHGTGHIAVYHTNEPYCPISLESFVKHCQSSGQYCCY
jgi:hypothetical protein